MKISNRQQLLVILAAALVGLLLTDRMVVTPLIRLWKSREETIASLKEKFHQGTALIERRAALAKQWDRMRTNMLSGRVSAAEDQFLKTIERWAQESRLTLSAVKPQWQRPSDAKSQEQIAILECNLETTGNLGAVTRFLYNLEKDPLGVRVIKAQITARDDAGEQLTLNLQLSALAAIAKTEAR